MDNRIPPLLMGRRALLRGGAATGCFALLGGVGDKLFANRGFADFIAGFPNPAQWRERINQGLAECAAAGMPVTGSAGDYPFEGPLHIPAGLKIACEPGCIIRKAYDDRGTRSALLLTAGDHALDADGFEWAGGEFRPMDEALGRGNLATLFGRGWTFRNAVMRDWRDGQCFMFGGGGFLMSGIDARATQRKVGTGVYRCLWNDPALPSRCENLYGVGGDDVFQAVPMSAPDHPRFGLDIGHLTYENCTGHSLVARLIAVMVAQGQPENATLLPSRITNCVWRNVAGSGANRTVVIQNSFGDTARNSMVDEIVLESCRVDCGPEVGKVGDSVRLWSDRAGIGCIRILGGGIRGSRMPRLMVVDGVDQLVLGDGLSLAGSGQLLRAGERHSVGAVTLRDVDLWSGHGGPLVWAKLDRELLVDNVRVSSGQNLHNNIRLMAGSLSFR